MIFINTCVLPRCHMEEIQKYKDRYGDKVGFEILSMFDLPKFEKNLEENLSLFEGSRVTIHGPVWEAEHSAPRGSAEYELTMRHIVLTQKFAKLLQPETFVYHLNNCAIADQKRSDMLHTALLNRQEIMDMFPETEILVENTGLSGTDTMLLDQQEFIDFCIENDLPVILDVGHAAANGWDILYVIDCLKDRIKEYHLHNNDGKRDLHNRLRDGIIDMESILKYIKEKTPFARYVIEYTREEYDGSPLMEDIDWALSVLDE